MSIILIIVFGIILNKCASRLKIPNLLLYLLCGIVIGPFGFNLLSSQFLGYSSELRHAALVIILLRAGIGMNLKSLKKVGRPALLMSFVPGVFEAMAVAFMCMILLGFQFTEGGMLGFILAAVSPAVVVPMMIKLESEKRGTDKGIPSLILAGASLDDIFAITLFSVFSGLYFGTSENLLVTLIMIPIRIILGMILGYAVGGVMKRFKKIPKIILLVIALAVSKLDLYLPLASLMSVMVMGFVIAHEDEPRQKELDTYYGNLWFIAQMFLFMLVGASFDPAAALNAGAVGIVILLIGLVFRCVGVFISLIKTPLTANERIYCAIAYIPKATVQAAMGGVPLALGVASGNTMLAISVLAILITTPLGAILMNHLAPKLLQKQSS